MSSKKSQKNALPMVIIGVIILLLSIVKVISSSFTFIGVILLISGLSSLNKPQEKNNKSVNLKDLFTTENHETPKAEESQKYDTNRYQINIERNKNFEYERYCKNCGRSVKKETICPECGNKID